MKALIDDLVMGNHILYDQKVMDGYGHLSARDPRDPNRFLMSRARAPGMVEAADIMVFGLDGEPIKDDGRPVYSERFIHSEVYQARPDVNAVVHTHSPTVIPFSVTQVPLKPIRARFFYPEVPVFEIREAGGWTNLLVSNPALGRALAEKLGDNSVALLRGHGNVVVGPTLRIAVYRAIYTEANAKLLAAGQDAGRPDHLSRARGGGHHGKDAREGAARSRQRPHLGNVGGGGEGTRSQSGSSNPISSAPSRPRP